MTTYIYNLILGILKETATQDQVLYAHVLIRRYCNIPSHSRDGYVHRLIKEARS